MAMTIDEAIDSLVESKYSPYEAPSSCTIDIAIDTMRKYQKIQEVMDSRPDDDAKSNSKTLGEIEVIMYDDND